MASSAARPTSTTRIEIPSMPRAGSRAGAGDRQTRPCELIAMGARSNTRPSRSPFVTNVSHGYACARSGGPAVVRDVNAPTAPGASAPDVPAAISAGGPGSSLNRLRWREGVRSESAPRGNARSSGRWQGKFVVRNRHARTLRRVRFVRGSSRSRLHRVARGARSACRERRSRARVRSRARHRGATRDVGVVERSVPARRRTVQRLAVRAIDRSPRNSRAPHRVPVSSRTRRRTTSVASALSTPWCGRAARWWRAGASMARWRNSVSKR